MKKPLLLMILDGWGKEEGGPGDALAASSLPNFRFLWRDYPHTYLNASGLDVGLPAGQMGNSEVGHMNMGAGRVVYQELTLISKSIAEGDFFTNPALLKACAAAKQPGAALHLLGLISDGGVHSHMEHIFALVRLAKSQGVERVYIHCFLDGRDTAPNSGQGFVSALADYCRSQGCGRIASVCGRFYAMDRDKRWERLSRGYELLVHGQGQQATDPLAAIWASYERGVSDEFVEPVAILGENGQPITIRDNDGVIFFNFRADRARELSHALTDAEFTYFDRGPHPPRLGCYTCMTAYDDTLSGVEIAFPPHPIVNNLSQVLEKNGLRQLRIAETEKYAHVTFFFNSGVEEEAVGEDRLLIPSPQVETYDLQPEMSAAQVTEAVIQRINSGVYDVIILNYANPDMVGHTGVFPAACQAVEFVDQCIGRVKQALAERGGSLLITADHGNVERMLDQGQPATAHTTNQVPFILVDEAYKGAQLRQGRLEDIAPTILAMMGIPQPAEMTGRSLIKNN